MTNINGNILTINACRSMGALEHIRVDGSQADQIKSFTIGERAYVLNDVDALKSKLAAAQEALRAAQAGTRDFADLVRRLECERDGLKESRDALINKHNLMVRERDEAREQLAKASAEREELRASRSKLIDQHNLAISERSEAYDVLCMLASQFCYCISNGHKPRGAKGSPMYNALAKHSQAGNSTTQAALAVYTSERKTAQETLIEQLQREAATAKEDLEMLASSICVTQTHPIKIDRESTIGRALLKYAPGPARSPGVFSGAQGESTGSDIKRYAFQGPEMRNMLHMIVDALDAAGAEARAAGYPINAADKIRDQIYARTSSNGIPAAKR